MTSRFSIERPKLGAVDLSDATRSMLSVSWKGSMELRNFIIGYLILPCACVSFGQTAVPETTACETRAAEPPHATAAEQTRLAQRFVDDKVAVWRQRLKLENW